MNVYDQAHQLAQAIRESEEYKQHMNLKKQVDANPELEPMIKDFMEKQFQMQAATLMGAEIDQELMSNVQRLSAVIMSDPTAAQYMQCQVRLSMMMADVYKIISDASGIDLGHGAI